MVVDTSAIVALLQDEPDAELFEAALADSADSVMSVASALEAGLVLERRYGVEGARLLDALIVDAEIALVAFDHEQLEFARAAFRRFGRGRHPARLNFGDCFAYALAKQRKVPLLFKGDGFAQTDIESVL